MTLVLYFFVGPTRLRFPPVSTNAKLTCEELRKIGPYRKNLTVHKCGKLKCNASEMFISNFMSVKLTFLRDVF